MNCRSNFHLFFFKKTFQENDEEAKQIAKEGQLTARDLLQPHRLYCYYFRVLQVSSEHPSW
jgi:hypothetical protein